MRLKPGFDANTPGQRKGGDELFGPALIEMRLAVELDGIAQPVATVHEQRAALGGRTQLRRRREVPAVAPGIEGAEVLRCRAGPAGNQDLLAEPGDEQARPGTDARGPCERDVGRRQAEQRHGRDRAVPGHDRLLADMTGGQGDVAALAARAQQEFVPLATAIALAELAPVRAGLQAFDIAAQADVDHAGDRAAAMVCCGGAGVDLDALDRGQRDAVQVGVAAEREAIECARAGPAQSARPAPAVDQDQGSSGAQATQVDRRAAVAGMAIAGAARPGHRQARQHLAQRHQAGGAQRLAVQHPRRSRTGARVRRRAQGEHVRGPGRHRRRGQPEGDHNQGHAGSHAFPPGGSFATCRQSKDGEAGRVVAVDRAKVYPLRGGVG